MRVRTAFAASGAAHVLLGFALSATVWSTAPEEPVPAAVSVVFEAPADQQAAVPAAAEPDEPEPAQPEPAALPDRVDATPALPIPEPTPEPPSPPPPIVQTPPLPPPPLPHWQPPPRRLTARSPVAKPVPSQPEPAAAPAAEPVPSVSGAPTGASAPQTAQSESPAVVGWNRLFSAWLAERKTYPELARRRGEQGNVTLHFKVGVDGTVLEVALVTGSGSPVLDEAARALLRNARVPPPQTEISRTVRLRYRLDD